VVEAGQTPPGLRAPALDRVGPVLAAHGPSQLLRESHPLLAQSPEPLPDLVHLDLIVQVQVQVEQLPLFALHVPELLPEMFDLRPELDVSSATGRLLPRDRLAQAAGRCSAVADCFPDRRFRHFGRERGRPAHAPWVLAIARPRHR
jgi:hypothetical protein